MQWTLPDSSMDQTNKHAKLYIMTGSTSRARLVDTASALCLCGHLTQSIFQFGRRLITNVLVPVLSGATVEIKSQSISKEPELHVNHHDQQSQKIAETFQTICSVMKYLETCGFNAVLTTDSSTDVSSSSVSLMSELGDAIGEEVIDLIIKQCIVNTIPTTHEELRSYDNTATIVELFQKDLIKYKFLQANNRKLTDYVDNVDTLFVDKQCEQILIQAERLMKADMHNTGTVSIGKPTKPLEPLVKGRKISQIHNDAAAGSDRLSDDTFYFPNCCIR